MESMLRCCTLAALLSGCCFQFEGMGALLRQELGWCASRRGEGEMRGVLPFGFAQGRNDNGERDWFSVEKQIPTG